MNSTPGMVRTCSFSDAVVPGVFMKRDLPSLMDKNAISRWFVGIAMTQRASSIPSTSLKVVRSSSPLSARQPCFCDGQIRQTWPLCPMAKGYFGRSDAGQQQFSVASQWAHCSVYVGSRYPKVVFPRITCGWRRTNTFPTG